MLNSHPAEQKTAVPTSASTTTSNVLSSALLRYKKTELIFLVYITEIHNTYNIFSSPLSYKYQSEKLKKSI